MAGDREREPPPEIFQDSAAGVQARRKMGDAIVSSMTRKFITDGLALGYRYDPSPICWSEAGAAPHTWSRLSPERGDRQPRAARVAQGWTLGHRPVRRADSPCCALATRTHHQSSAPSRSEACRSRSRPSPIRPSPRSTNASSSSCGQTGTWPGAAMCRLPTRWRWPTRCAGPSDPPPRRSACRRDRRGGSCRAGISPTA